MNKLFFIALLTFSSLTHASQRQSHEDLKQIRFESILKIINGSVRLRRSNCDLMTLPVLIVHRDGSCTQETVYIYKKTYLESDALPHGTAVSLYQQAYMSCFLSKVLAENS